MFVGLTSEIEPDLNHIIIPLFSSKNNDREIETFQLLVQSLGLPKTIKFCFWMRRNKY